MLWRRIPNPPAGWPPPREQQSVTANLDYARVRDPIGHHIHIVLAALYLFTLPLSTTPKDVAFGILVTYAVVRLHCTWRSYTYLLRDRLGWLLIAWTAWTALGLLWSDDVRQGLAELRAYRVVLTGFALWPVMETLPFLIGIFLGGVVAQNVIQLAQSMDWFNLHPGVNDRLRGLLHPIHTGTVCTVAMCWHLCALVHSRRWWPRLIFVAGLAAATTGLVFSGSRGPWIAAAVALPLAVVVTAIRRPPTRRAMLVIGVGAIVGAGAFWPIAQPMIVKRVNQSITDLREAKEGRYESDVGARLAVWRSATEMFQESPLFGVGTGGYPNAFARSPYAEITRARHAHSLYMHVLACSGIVGGLLVLGVVLVVLSRAYRDPPDHIFADGTLFALVAWLVGAAFDAYQLTGQMFGVFAFMCVAVIPMRPVPFHEPVIRAEGSGEP